MSGRAKWAIWGVLGLVLAVSLALGASRPGAPETPARRAAAIDASLRCPSCDGISVLDSSAATAVSIRQLVSARVAEGQSTAQIVSFLESRYGEGILLEPPASGSTAAVWVVPVVVVTLGLAGLGTFFWRRRRTPRVEVAEEDRALVLAAMQESTRSTNSGARSAATPGARSVSATSTEASR